MKKVRLQWGFMTCVCFLLVCGVASTQAGDLDFPKTEEEIIKILGVPPENGEVTGAIPSSGDGSSLFDDAQQPEGNTRGLGGIIEDDEALAKAPKAGALILFDFNSAVIKADSKPLLREYGKALQGALKDVVLVVAGHTDSKGSEVYNLKLSERRAKAVQEFLVAEFEIEEDRLRVKPYGERNPVETNTTSEGRAINRRVEFIRIQ